ncbi:MscS family mechanosensitive channel [Escherichia coli]
MTMFQYYKRSRHFVFSAFIAFVFVLLCQNTAFARASSNGDLPTKADLQAQLDSLNKQKDLSAQDKLVQQDLTDTLATLDKIDRIKEETVQLRQKVAEAPEKMRQATAALTALSDVDNDEETRKILSTLSLRQLETRVAQALDDLQNAQNDLASYNSQLVSLQTQPERVQNAMYNASQQLQQIRSRLDGTDVGETALRPSQKVLMQAQQALLNAEIDQQRKSLEGNTVLQDTLQKQRDYVTANSARLEHQLQLLQEAVNSKRLTLTEKTAQEAVSPDEAARIQANPLVKQELEINQQLSQRLITATENGNQLMQQNIKVKNWLERALQSERNIKEQIAVLKGSLLLSRILYQQQQTLPSADELENMTNRIADLRLEQFEVNQQRDALFQSDAFVNKLEEGHTNEVNSEVHDALLQVVDMRRELLDQLNKQLGNQLMMAINLQINQQQLMSVSKNLKSILTQQIFWVNSNRPMDWDWIKAFPQSLKDEFKSMKITVNWEKAWPAVFIAFLAGLPLLLIAFLVWPMCRESWRDKESHTMRLVTITVLSIIPIALMVLTATGYFYTTLRLSGRWIETVYLVIIWNLLYQTVLRGLSVAARRIAWRRALARRQNLVKEGAEGAEPPEEPTIALEQVNQQTLRITMLLMFALFGVMFWAIWSDLITVFSYLDSITLWHYNGTEAGAAVVKNVTMGSLLFAIIASMVAWALIRNLPGLLEVLVLSRLNMRQGASYAITTILNYIIIAVGAMTVFGSLGVSWDKLQWLAAALSVGLGFGLQEIFGNFVSGLIILFERPVRIGDTVTIGSFSGTVSKIRIRATTITDFDRKEVIIPNKAFVTERLINWSLTDTTTRLVIRLGVAYGSDLEKVRKVLLKAATEHPRVMHEPMPEVFFTAFGASTLDHELRLYVRELRDRSRTVDELNRTIDQLCRENDINIAFNQLEVHLHNEKGDEVTEVKRDYKGDDPTPAVG